VRLAKPATDVLVAHVLLGWRGSLPTNGPDRDESASRVLAIEIAHKARQRGRSFMQLAWQHSDDEGAGIYRIDKNTRHRYVGPFVKAARKLGVGQVDAIRSPFGYHVIRRMEPDFRPPKRPLRSLVPGPCPLPDEDQARCPRNDAQTASKSVVEHILIGYKGSLSRRHVARHRKQARQLAVEVTHKARRRGANFAALRVRFSDDPGSGRYEVSADSMHDKRFSQLALRLGPGQVDAVQTSFGFHIVKRVR